MDHNTFSDLVGAVYDGAVDASLWPETLGRICATFGFRKATIDLNRVPGMTNLFNFHYGIDAQQATTMVSHYDGMLEVWGGRAAAMVRAIDRPWIVSRIMTPEALRQTEYYRNWVGPMGLVDGVAIVLARDHSLLGSLRMATDARRGMIDDKLVEALAQLLPHCQRAARINGLLDASRRAACNFQAVIDSMSVPVVLVSADCSIVHANPCANAMLEQNAVLASRHGRLTSPVPGLQHAIGKTVCRVVQDETNIPGNGIGLSVRGTDGAARTLHLLPLAQRGVRAKLARDAVAAIFVSSGSVGQDLVRDILQSLYQLTHAELGVFDCILAGKTTRQITVELGIASSTVRTHVLRIFQKTATHCRADLVRLAHGLAPPVVQ